MSKRPAIKTYDRIVSESLALFNEHGERTITTNHIAAHLGISPGNLYYHFRNKEEIVYQIFLQYKHFLTERLAAPADRDIKVDDMERYFDTVFQAMWQFRFMFYDLPGLLARNPQMQAEYHHFIHTDLEERLNALFHRFAEIGLFRIDEEDIRPMVTNVWLVAKFWFAFEQASRPKEPISEAAGNRGVCQVLALFKPYVPAEFLPTFRLLASKYAAAN